MAEKKTKKLTHATFHAVYYPEFCSYYRYGTISGKLQGEGHCQS